MDEPDKKSWSNHLSLIEPESIIFKAKISGHMFQNLASLSFTHELSFFQNAHISAQKQTGLEYLFRQLPKAFLASNW